MLALRRLLLLELLLRLVEVLLLVVAADVGVMNFSSVPAGRRDLLLDGVEVLLAGGYGEAVEAEGIGCVLSESRTMGLELLRDDDDELFADLPPFPECAAAFIAIV